MLKAEKLVKLKINLKKTFFITNIIIIYLDTLLAKIHTIRFVLKITLSREQQKKKTVDNQFFRFFFFCRNKR